MKFYSGLIFFGLFLLLFTTSSCRKNIQGDVRIYGTIEDAYNGQVVNKLSLRLFKREKRNTLVEVFPDITLDSTSGEYSVRYITEDCAELGYVFRWYPIPGISDEYYFENLDYGERIIGKNENSVNIRLHRMGYMTVRLIDVAPFNFLPYPEFYCDGNQQPVNLYNFNGDTTFTVKLIPDHDNFYELISRSNNFTDTIIAGVINMNLSGDTLFNTLQF